MSSENMDAVMDAEEQAQGLVPKLRFPEFQEAGDWAYQPLGAFANILDERVGSKTYIPYSITSGIGLVSQQEKFGRTIAGSQLKNYFVLQPQDFAYNKSATKEYPQGFAVMFEGDAPGCVPASIFTCFRIHDSSVSAKYLNFLLRGNLHGRWLAKYSAVGARATGSLAIDDKDLLALPVPLPAGNTSTTEQQKIADCLSSLDAVIAAEGDRLAALKDHKKGLMQQLFPAKDQTTPRLRFPEFESAVAWVETPLGQLAEYQNGKAYEPHIVENGRFAVVNARFISTDGTVRKSSNSALMIADKGDVLMVLSDLPNGKALAKCFLVDADDTYAVNQRIVRLKPHAVGSEFLFFMLNRHPFLLSFNDGQNQTHLSKDNVLNCPILHPSDEAEQRQISDCLASIDQRIMAQTDQLLALKRHKMALMQQLFPSPYEATA